MYNCNAQTGVRFGTIYLHELDQDVAAWLWDTATNVSEAEAYAEERKRLEAYYVDLAEEQNQTMDEDDLERLVEAALQNFDPACEEPTLVGEQEGVKYMISHLGGAALLWVTESPYTVKAALCSPCVPNAGSLGSPGEYECYGLPLEWMSLLSLLTLFIGSISVDGK